MVSPLGGKLFHEPPGTTNASVPGWTIYPGSHPTALQSNRSPKLRLGERSGAEPVVASGPTLVSHREGLSNNLLTDWIQSGTRSVGSPWSGLGGRAPRSDRTLTPHRREHLGGYGRPSDFCVSGGRSGAGRHPWEKGCEEPRTASVLHSGTFGEPFATVRLRRLSSRGLARGPWPTSLQRPAALARVGRHTLCAPLSPAPPTPSRTPLQSRGAAHTRVHARTRTRLSRRCSLAHTRLTLPAHPATSHTHPYPHRLTTTLDAVVSADATRGCHPT